MMTDQDWDDFEDFRAKLGKEKGKKLWNSITLDQKYDLVTVCRPHKWYHLPQVKKAMKESGIQRVAVN